MRIYVHVDRYGDVKILAEDIDTNVVDPKQIVANIREAAIQVRREVQQEQERERKIRGWG